ncbi:MAG: WXG100 family type VII secretion target [Phycisphaerales bacterium]
MTDSGRFTVDLDELNRVIEELRDMTQQVESGIEQLVQRTTTLHQEWSGVAATSHSEAHAEWTQGAREMAEGLADMQKVAANAHAMYTAAVDANTEMFR